ncbi:hypothetical protein EJB05_16418 [Eragrostis curvula]|uniref:Serine/threonine-protein kinase BSK1-like TPR repeats domain-containing protein n=1 Tax=Eragrostis curvula TaxID=38414 RepID=A0A5J9VGJ6_9POAL|nr:hypothetical protein EJB05_16418 [Eragrostis curvula]
MAAPFVYRRTNIDGNSERALLKAAMDGDLDRVKGIIKSLSKGKDNRAPVFSLKNGGYEALQTAACMGHLEICKYFVEELGADVNMIAGEGAAEGATAFMASAQSGDISTVKYFLEHGGDLMKVDAKGRTILHHAVSTEGRTVYLHYLITPNYAPNIIFSGIGTPLNGALIYRSLKCMKLLIKASILLILFVHLAGADVNGKGSVMSPLLFATGQGGYTKFIPLLLKAGADPNLPDDTETQIKERKAMIKSYADQAFRRKEYEVASKLYSLVIDHKPDATVYSNRSLCKLLMGDGEGALSDAYQCRMMRPNWAKACYRQAAAHMLLKEYKQAFDALLDAQKLDPGNDDIERELSKAMELMKVSPGKDQH